MARAIAGRCGCRSGTVVPLCWVRHGRLCVCVRTGGRARVAGCMEVGYCVIQCGRCECGRLVGCAAEGRWGGCGVRGGWERPRGRLRDMMPFRLK